MATIKLMQVIKDFLSCSLIIRDLKGEKAELKMS